MFFIHKVKITYHLLHLLDLSTDKPITSTLLSIDKSRKDFFFVGYKIAKLSIKYTRYSYQHLDHDILIGRYRYLFVLSSLSEKNPAGGTSGEHYEQQKLFLDG